MKTTSLRQSDGWAKYLKALKWEMLDTRGGIRIAVLKTLLGTVSKIQRPKKFTEAQLKEIEDICTKKKAMFIKIEPGYEQNEKLLQKHGYIRSNFPLSPPSSLVIDLTKSEKDLWQDLSKSAKYSTRRAEREGNYVKYFKDPDEEVVQRLQKVCKETGKRGKFYVPPYKELIAKRKAFKDEFFVIEVYDKDEDLVSVKFYIASKNTVTYLQGGTTSIGRKGKGGYLLMWESIKYFKKLGYEYLDLDGVDDDRFPSFTKKWGGFSHFKEKFGGKIFRFPPPYIKYFSPILKFLSRFQELPL